MNSILPDTNIWLGDTWLMRSPIGAALLFAVEQMDANLLLPEVVEREVLKHVLRFGIEADQQIEATYRQIKMLAGRRDDYRIPTPEDYSAAVVERFNELDDRLVRLPFTLDHARGALSRVIEGSPPNGTKNQQFKDSAIWEAAMEAASRGPVHFITRDKGFFDERNPSKGLALNLKEELAARATEIHVHWGADSFLSVIQQDLPSVEEAPLVQAVIGLVTPPVKQRAEREGGLLGPVLRSEVQLFLTEMPSVLAVDFLLVYRVDLEEDRSAKMAIEGSCSYDLRTGRPDDLKLDQITAAGEDGAPIPRLGAKFLHGLTAHFGRREIPTLCESP